MYKLDRFMVTFDGRKMDLDGVAGFQCVDLVNAWCLAIGIELFPGDAKDFQFDSHPDCSWVPLAPGILPGHGDIIVWARSAELPFGHVAICDWANTTEFASFDQNWPLGSGIHHQLHVYGGVAGWLRPQLL